MMRWLPDSYKFSLTATHQYPSSRLTKKLIKRASHLKAHVSGQIFLTIRRGCTFLRLLSLWQCRPWILYKAGEWQIAPLVLLRRVVMRSPNLEHVIFSDVQHLQEVVPIPILYGHGHIRVLAWHVPLAFCMFTRVWKTVKGCPSTARRYAVLMSFLYASFACWCRTSSMRGWAWHGWLRLVFKVLVDAVPGSAGLSSATVCVNRFVYSSAIVCPYNKHDNEMHLNLWF